MARAESQIGVIELKEPFPQERDRVRPGEINQKAALAFAYSLQSIEGINTPHENFEIERYKSAILEETPFYTRIATSDSASLGIVITDIERANIETDENDRPVLYTFGPERTRLALAQRAEFFLQHQSEKVLTIVEGIIAGEKNIPSRINRKHAALEKALDIQNGTALSTAAFSDLGYKKRSSEKELSRGDIALHGLFNRDGRRVIGIGSLPPVSGWRDVVVTAAMAHMPVFIPRNNLFADVGRRIQLIKESQEAIERLDISDRQKKLAFRNIGVAIGTDDPKKELENVIRIYEETGAKLFRAPYTINADPRFIETPRLIRNHFGDEVEIWSGQIADRRQVELLLEEVNGHQIADTGIWGHAAGRQCTSAINGLGITMIEDIYDVIQESSLNGMNIAVEGGVGNLVAIPLLLGADYVLYNQQLVHGTIEAGDLLLKHKNGKLAQPYPGSASPTTQIIESSFEKLRKTRTASAGRTTNPEGKPGFMFFERKANSMVFYVREFLGYAARMLADLGVRNIGELRTLLAEHKNEEVLRIVTDSTSKLTEAYRN